MQHESILVYRTSALGFERHILTWLLACIRSLDMYGAIVPNHLSIFFKTYGLFALETCFDLHHHQRMDLQAHSIHCIDNAVYAGENNKDTIESMFSKLFSLFECLLCLEFICAHELLAYHRRRAIVG